MEPGLDQTYSIIHCEIPIEKDISYRLKIGGVQTNKLENLLPHGSWFKLLCFKFM